MHVTESMKSELKWWYLKIFTQNRKISHGNSSFTVETDASNIFLHSSAIRSFLPIGKVAIISSESIMLPKNVIFFDGSNCDFSGCIIKPICSINE
jgi:hypothetical protein